MAKATDIKGKIRNLLALAQSPNENEAKAALLKARELMITHKLTEAELGDAKDKTVQKVPTDVTYSKRRDPWISPLSAIIGEKFCCTAFQRRVKGKQTQTAAFIGFAEDIEICRSVFEYAVDCIRSEIERIKKEYKGYPADYVTSKCVGYGYGFVFGIENAFARQNEKNPEWALVLTKPNEVIAEAEKLQKVDFKPKAARSVDADTYNKGYADGKEFDPKKRLEAMA